MPNSDITSHIKSGSTARLIPVVADSKKEERATSVLLSAFRFVPQFAESVLAEAGAKIGQRSTIKCYTEIVFNNKDYNNLRPDVLIVVTRGKQSWSALVESKVGNNNLNKEQIENYLDLAKAIGANALITISNQFATIPTHHPVSVSKTKTRSVDLFHFSWMSVLSKAVIMSDSKSVDDREQSMLMKELVRYLDHPYSGVSPMSSMNSDWKDICSQIQQGATLKKTAKDVEMTVCSWHQLFRYLSITLSTSTGSNVLVVLPRTHTKDPTIKVHDDANELSLKSTLSDELHIPNAAANISVTADFMRRVVTIRMRLKAPEDRTKATASINWLTRQLKGVEDDSLIIRAIWPGKTPDTQATLPIVLDNPNTLIQEGINDIPKYLEVTRIIDLGGKFKGAKVFVENMLTVVPDFYREIGQNLKKWVPQPPKAKENTPSQLSNEGDIGDSSHSDTAKPNFIATPPQFISSEILLKKPTNE